ncbi:MAG TPA: conjugal transfer protein TraX [Candidatus Agathobaculum merdavium]|nr:conjugal transfer protein TraX [Candidatus Agathobaculum merdavium]
MPEGKWASCPRDGVPKGWNMHNDETGGLSQNQIKLIAAAAMAIDHVGTELLPQYVLLRIIGRLAFPVFAYCIAEGSRYTRHPAKYLARLAVMGLACMAVYYFYAGAVYGNVLITFSLSLGVLYAFRFARSRWTQGARGRVTGAAVLLGSLCVVAALCAVMTVDYGFWGVVLPLWAEAAAYLLDGRIPPERARLAGFAAGLVVLSWQIGGIQWYSLLTLPLLAAYNGTRGKHQLGRFFYWFYPAHLLVIGLIAMLL